MRMAIATDLVHILSKTCYLLDKYGKIRGTSKRPLLYKLQTKLQTIYKSFQYAVSSFEQGINCTRYKGGLLNVTLLKMVLSVFEPWILVL